MSTQNVNPSELFGGTWDRIEDRFLLASGQNYEEGVTGGEAEHTLISDEIPAHTHGSKSLTGDFRSRKWETGALFFGGSGIVSLSETSTEDTYSAAGTQTAYKSHIVNINATHEHNSVGGGSAHNNMPPYIVVNVWKRTA